MSSSRDADAKTFRGIVKLVRQPAAQFEMWTGQPAPADLMRQIVLERLASRE